MECLQQNRFLCTRVVMLHSTMVVWRQSQKSRCVNIWAAHMMHPLLNWGVPAIQVTTWGDSVRHGNVSGSLDQQRALPRFLDDFLRHHTTQESAQPRRNAPCLYICYSQKKLHRSQSRRTTPKLGVLAHQNKPISWKFFSGSTFTSQKAQCTLLLAVFGQAQTGLAKLHLHLRSGNFEKQTFECNCQAYVWNPPKLLKKCLKPKWSFTKLKQNAPLFLFYNPSSVALWLWFCLVKFSWNAETVKGSLAHRCDAGWCPWFFCHFCTSTLYDTMDL